MAATQEVADYLRSRGHDVAAYSGQTETTERLALEEALATGTVKALVATSALGMGFDATLGFVVNLGAPQSPVAYYQQVGRAGPRPRTRPERCRRTAAGDRGPRHLGLLRLARPSLARSWCGRRSEVLREEGRPMSVARLEARVELNRTRLETMLKVLDVDGAVRRVRGGWEATGQEWAYDEDRYQRVREAREREQQAMLDYLATDRCRMWFLRTSSTTPRRPSAAAATTAAASTLPARCRPQPSRRRPLGSPARGRGRAAQDVADRAELPWASSSPGKIKDGAEPGRAIARLTDLGYGNALRDLFRDETPDGPVPVPLARAVRRGARRLAARVDGIVVVESASRPDLTADLADGLSRFLQVPIARSLGDRRPRRRGPARARSTRRSGWPPSAGGPT